ncbi:hypothetical protein Taro_012849 [Colocasia esculenta]|uniref:Uncharacterized protein n=1 Tax=Colocasia esculenta TaxID=4460 RepID=A0A843UKF7_COLES|nr:hypothetical protein [Colocasia esculenta]
MRFCVASGRINVICKASTVSDAFWVLWSFCVGRAVKVLYSDFGVVYAGVVQTCTTNSRVVESCELVLPRSMPQHRVSSVGRICQPICTAGSLFGIAVEPGDAILNASYMPNAIPGTTSVIRGMGFYLASDRGDAAEEALSGIGEVAVAPSMEVSGGFDFGWLMQRGNHARTMLEAWACRRRGGFGAFFSVFFQ